MTCHACFTNSANDIRAFSALNHFWSSATPSGVTSISWMVLSVLSSRVGSGFLYFGFHGAAAAGNFVRLFFETWTLVVPLGLGVGSGSAAGGDGSGSVGADGDSAVAGAPSDTLSDAVGATAGSGAGSAAVGGDANACKKD